MLDAIFKLCIFGDGGVGKTTLVGKYVKGIFTGDTTMTIGMDFHEKRVEIDGNRIGLQIWDFAGEERFRFFLPVYAKGANGAFFMYDITRYLTLENLTDWMSVFNGLFSDADLRIPVFLVGSKIDLEDLRAVTTKDAQDMAEAYNMTAHRECSAKTGLNVEEIFLEITKSMMEKAGFYD